jgi:hypothetical protein
MKRMPPDRRVTREFLSALRAARQTYGDIAEQLGYSQRLLEMYAAGERNVTFEAVTRLVAYLDKRITKLGRHTAKLAGAALGMPSRAEQMQLRKAFLAAKASKE